MFKNLLLIFILLSNHGLHALESLSYCNSLAVMNYVKNFLPEDSIIIECGGADGTDTASLSEIWSKGRIYTFEPVPILFEHLTNRTKSFSNVYAYQLALGDFCGKTIFYVSKYKGINSGSSSILPPKEHLRLDSTTQFDEKIEVNVLTLDKWAADNNIERADFLWLDMQGYELNMIMNSELAKRSKAIYIEIEFIDLYAGQYLYDDVLKWMTSNSFELVAIDFDPAILAIDKNILQEGIKSLEYPSFGNALFIKK